VDIFVVPCLFRGYPKIHAGLVYAIYTEDNLGFSLFSW